MSILENLASAIRMHSHATYTENGDLTYDSDVIIDDITRLFYTASAGRKQIIDYKLERSGVVARSWSLYQNFWRKDFVNTYKHANKATQLKLLRLLGLVRDPRNGMGERSLFRGVLYELFRDQLLNSHELLNVVSHYGRWDDLLAVYAKARHGKGAIARMLVRQFRADLQAVKDGKEVSLLGKWLPKENTSNREVRRVAKELRTAFGLDRKSYQKAVVSLRKAIDVTEQKMSANQWGEIEYSNVPSLCMDKNHQAFRRHDPKRFEQYLSDVKEGKAKVNIGVLTPARVIKNISAGNPKLAIEQWKALDRTMVKRPLIPIVDTSGSMTATAGEGCSCMDVAISLGILLSECNPTPFKDLVITFSNNPTTLDLSGCGDIVEKCYHLMNDGDWGMNTNIEATLRLVLSLAKKSLPNGTCLPDLVIFSDMEFDEASRGQYVHGVMEAMQKEFEAEGFKMPKVVFWNLSTNGRAVVPLTQNDYGILLMSGYSQRLFRMLEGDETPEESVLSEIMDSYWDDMEKLWRKPKDLTSEN